MPCRGSRCRGGGWYYLDRSQRGDITAIRDDAGALEATAHYDAYGDVNWSYEGGADSTLASKLAHDYGGADGTVRLGDGLHWMGARVYGASQARFVSADRVESFSGEPGGAYNFASEDPVDNVDPSGDFTCNLNHEHLNLSNSAHYFRFDYRWHCWGVDKYVGGLSVVFCVAASSLHAINPHHFDFYQRCHAHVHWAGHDGRTHFGIKIPLTKRWCQTWAYGVAAVAYGLNARPGETYKYGGWVTPC